jgi:hypothetical protein
MTTAPPPPGSPAPAETPPEVNTETVARFRRQAWWQITFPVLAVTLLAVAGVVLLIVLGGPAAVSIVADYSLWLLIALGMVIAVVPLAITDRIANVVITVRSVLVGAGMVFTKDEGADDRQAGAAKADTGTTD